MSGKFGSLMMLPLSSRMPQVIIGIAEPLLTKGVTLDKKDEEV